MIPFWQAYTAPQIAYACFEQAALAIVFVVAFVYFLTQPRAASPDPLTELFPTVDRDALALPYRRDGRLSGVVTIGG